MSDVGRPGLAGWQARSQRCGGPQLRLVRGGPDESPPGFCGDRETGEHRWGAGCGPGGEPDGDVPGTARLGAAAGRLLAGPPEAEGMESLASHERRLGPIEVALVGGDLPSTITGAGVLGRGGGEFPLATKLRTAAQASSMAAVPLVVVNASEGEPASRKDRTLLVHRPHLVIDGAEVAAAAIGAPDVVLYVHGGDARVDDALRRALSERPDRPGRAAVLHLVRAPDRYVAGESSAVVAVLEGRGPFPSRRPVPVAVSGVGGRPTVVANAESIAHLALAARFGAGWFAEAGTPDAPGSTLLTLAGGVSVPGLVVEVLQPVPFGAVLRGHGGWDVAPEAVLVGGYGGRWLPGAALWSAPVDRAGLRRAGAGLGCGLVAPLPPGACGLTVTARLLRFLASQSAGQCGSCAFGLPAMAEIVEALARGDAGRGDVRRLERAALATRGSGACSHPDGAAELVESALHLFADDVAHHVRRGGCGADAAGWFPLPPAGHRRAGGSPRVDRP